MKIGDVVRHSTSDVQYIVIELVGPNGARVKALVGNRTKLLSRSGDVWFDDRWQTYKRIV